jgi:hypothetical protein
VGIEAHLAGIMAVLLARAIPAMLVFEKTRGWEQQRNHLRLILL